MPTYYGAWSILPHEFTDTTMPLRSVFSALAFVGIFAACGGDAGAPFGIRAGATGPILHSRVAVVPGVSDVAVARYHAVMDSKEAEKEVLARLARDQRTTVAAVRASVDSAMLVIHQPPAVDESSLRAAVQSVGDVQVLEIIPAGDYVAIRYVQQFQAYDDAEVFAGIEYGMPAIMGVALNAAPRIRQVQLVAHYPSTDGTPKRVALLNARRDEYDPIRTATSYAGYESSRSADRLSPGKAVGMKRRRRQRRGSSSGTLSRAGTSRPRRR